MEETPEFLDIDQARRVVADLYPNAMRVELIEHGYDNVVALVDERYAIHFPRNHEAFVRSRYEQAMLGQLDGITVVKVPQFLYECEDPAYLVTTYVPGEHRTPEEINAFSLVEQEDFGKTIGAFAYEMHSTISAKAEEAFRQQADFGNQFDESWEAYFERSVNGGGYVLPIQKQLAQDYYRKWLKVTEVNAPKVVIHDDLHIANMLFDGKRLVSVLDFAEANIGTAEQEFRQLYRINLHVLEAAVVTYNQLSGRQLDVEAIRIWAIMQDLGSYSRRLRAGQTDHPSFLRASAHLNQWLPDGQWDVTTA